MNKTYSGKANIMQNRPYAGRIYNIDPQDGSPTPPDTGFIAQLDGFAILQLDGNFILYNE